MQETRKLLESSIKIYIYMFIKNKTKQNKTKNMAHVETRKLVFMFR